MSDSCDMPPSLSFELPVLGPFTARECIVLGALILPSIPLLWISRPLGSAFLVSGGFLSFLLVFEWRRGKHPFSPLKAYIKRHSSISKRVDRRSLSSHSRHNGLEAYSIEGMNYACAVASEKESVLASSLAIFSSAEGCVRLMSVPLRSETLNLYNESPAGIIPGMDGFLGFRSFYLITSSEHNPVEHIGNARLKRVSSWQTDSFHDILSAPVPWWDAK